MLMSYEFSAASLLLFVVLFWTVQPFHLRAQSSDSSSNSPRSLLLKAKTTLNHGVNAGSLDSLRQARALFKQAPGSGEHQALAHYYAALADYRIQNLMPQDAEDKREPILDDAIDHLKQATTLDSTMADAWALLSSCYGQRLGLDPMRAMSLGPKADETLAKAKELAPENPRVWIVSGTSDFFTPSMFGGDKERALENFQKAARLAEQETVDDPLRPNWGHAEAYAWIGYAHKEAGRTEQSRQAFDTALEINPNYGWVKHSLLPELEKQAG